MPSNHLRPFVHGRRHVALGAALALAAVATSACTAVSRQAYDRDIAAMQQQTDWLEEQKRAHAKQAAEWQQKHSVVVGELGLCRKAYSDLEEDHKALETRLNNLAASAGSFGAALQACEQEKAKQRQELLAEREKSHKLAARLEAITAQLDAMRDTISSVRGKLADLVRAGKLRVEVKNGFLVIGLESDILFDTGKSVLKSDAHRVLLELAEVLRGFRDRRFQVAGHTDPRGGGDVNWPLSVGRALSVVDFMIKSGKVPPAMLSAGGYAHYLPSSLAQDEAGWRQNRRVEFLLMPDLTELYKLAEPTP